MPPPSIEFIKQTVKSPHEKLSIVGRCEEIGFALKRQRPELPNSEVLIFSRDWSAHQVLLTNLPTGGVNFAVDWPYHEWFKALAEKVGFDLVVGPSDGNPNLAFYEYAAEVSREEAKAFLSKWERERERLSQEAEAIVNPFGKSPFIAGA